MFQVMFNLVSCAIFVPMFYIELWTGAPLMKALILTIPLELASQLAMLSILTEASTAILMLALMPLMVKVYSRLWPATAIDRLSQVEFVHSRAYGAVAVALELAALLDFTHFKRHKRGNLQYDGKEWRGVSVHRSWRSIVKNPPTPTTSGYAQR